MIAGATEMPRSTPSDIPPLRDGDRLTRDEFMRRWEAMPDLHRAELIDGVVHLPSPVSNTHDRHSSHLIYWLGHYTLLAPGCEFGGNGTWFMLGNNAPQPDAALWIPESRGGRVRVVNDYPVGAPELIIEISKTTSARDRGSKLAMYRRSGVSEYVTVHPKRRKIVWRQLVNGRYHELPADEDGWFRSRIFPGLWLDPEALWKRDLAGLANAVRKGVAATATLPARKRTARRR